MQEAVDRHHRLAERIPDAFESDLAMSLSNLGGELSELGQRAAACVAMQEAVDLYRRLAERNPGAFEPDLAAGSSNHSRALSEVRPRDAALAAR
jgi:hypothetical protein